MAHLLETIRAEIDRRLKELRPLAREARNLQGALDPLCGVTAAAPAGGRRRQSAQPAAPGRADRSARDVHVSLMEYVAANPGYTASDVAKALALNRNSVATRLTQLSKRGALVKAPRGYSAA